jgi:hypothetical protein
LAQTVIEGDLRTPAQFLADFAAVDGVPPIVPRAVGDKFDTVLAGDFSALLPDDADDLAHELDVRDFMAAADVVGFARFAALDDLPDRLVVVINVEQSRRLRPSP